MSSAWVAPVVLPSSTLTIPSMDGVPRTSTGHLKNDDCPGRATEFTYLGATYDIAQIRKIAQGITILYLYSGPARDGDLQEMARHLGGDAVMVDICRSGLQMDLLDQDAVDHWCEQLCNYAFQAVLMAMPCRTFSGLRGIDETGPQPLRGIHGRDVYGLPNLSIKDREEVKEGNVHALIGVRVALLCKQLGIPWIAETPRYKEGYPSLLRLPEWASIWKDPSTIKATVWQCGLGSTVAKPTELWGSVSLDGLPTRCSHQKQLWIVPWSGERYMSAHPILKGKQLAISADLFSEAMLMDAPPAGPYPSQEAAHYPMPMNEQLAFRLLICAGLARMKNRPHSHRLRAVFLMPFRTCQFRVRDPRSLVPIGLVLPQRSRPSFRTLAT